MVGRGPPSNIHARFGQRRSCIRQLPDESRKPGIPQTARGLVKIMTSEKEVQVVEERRKEESLDVDRRTGCTCDLCVFLDQRCSRERSGQYRARQRQSQEVPSSLGQTQMALEHETEAELLEGFLPSTVGEVNSHAKCLTLYHPEQRSLHRARELLESECCGLGRFGRPTANFSNC